MTEPLGFLTKKQLKLKKQIQDYAEASTAISKFLEQNQDMNLDYVIDAIKSMKISTVKCAEELGISPTAFRRLRKKYNIEPISVITKRDNKKSFLSFFPDKAVKHYYNKFQIQRIPQSEIDLVQERSGRSLKLNKKVSWKPRGYHSNGKLKPKTQDLKKHGFTVYYDYINDVYEVRSQNTTTQILSRQEVDKLNFKYAKLKVFI